MQIDGRMRPRVLAIAPSLTKTHAHMDGINAAMYSKNNIQHMYARISTLH